MASKLKRVSEPSETAILALANREGRTFVAQLDRVIDAGLAALGEPLPDRTIPEDEQPEPQPEPPKTNTRSTRKGRTPAVAGAK